MNMQTSAKMCLSRPKGLLIDRREQTKGIRKKEIPSPEKKTKPARARPSLSVGHGRARAEMVGKTDEKSERRQIARVKDKSVHLAPFRGGASFPGHTYIPTMPAKFPPLGTHFRKACPRRPSKYAFQETMPALFRMQNTIRITGIPTHPRRRIRACPHPAAFWTKGTNGWMKA